MYIYEYIILYIHIHIYIYNTRFLLPLHFLLFLPLLHSTEQTFDSQKHAEQLLV